MTTTEHGIPSRYDRGCRCAPCTGAKTAQGYRTRERAAARAASTPELVPHGTLGGYTHWKCRCPKCRKAMAVYCADRRKRRKLAGASS